MVKQKVTSKSSKRYRYSSFKDKIDDLRIEPARNLGKRVHDHVESSHFLASFEHWEDTNMSANFASFADDVRPMAQTLPQILFHEEQIFEQLYKHISKHDEYSLQPLLDLLAQFCHDLGPDFMKFYERAMHMLTTLLDDAANFESSNVFEWGFNCLAYVYKYLSRVLAQDLLPTYNLLFPLVSHRKEYLSRFSAEALSFLVRKAKLKSLSAFVTHAFNQLRDVTESTEENACENNIYDGLKMLFTEALITTKESLHSKFNVIMEALVHECLSGAGDQCCISLVADVTMNVLRHASSDNAPPVYDVFISEVKGFLEDPSAKLDAPMKLLLTLAFAESGKKVKSWPELIDSVQKVLCHANVRSLSPEVTALAFCSILRNAPIPDLTKFHRTLFDFYLNNFPQNFIEFFKMGLSMDKDRMFSFNGAKSLQRYIDQNWEFNEKKIALFLMESRQNSPLGQKLALTIPKQFAESIAHGISAESEHLRLGSLFQILWKMQVLYYTSYDASTVIEPLIKTLLQQERLNDFEKDVLGNMLLLLNPRDNGNVLEILDFAVTNLGKFQDSVLCIKGLRQLLGKLENGSNKFSQACENQAFIQISGNLCLPDEQIRYESLKLLISLLKYQGLEVPEILNDCKIIEEIPRNLQTARDITMRIRKLGSDFAKMEPESLVSHVVFNYLFGILTVRFSPVWEGAYEVLCDVYEKNHELVWSLFSKFVEVLDNNFRLEYYEKSQLEEERAVFWSVSTSRLNDVLQTCADVFNSYSFAESSILELLKNRRGDLTYPGLIRNQALKGLLRIPQLAERHSRDIVPYMLKTDPSEENALALEGVEERPSSSSTWSEADRKLLLQLIGKFKNIKSIYKSEEVYQRFMDLLGSRTTEIQKLALDGILAYKESVVIKYRDNLRNLLDDNAFKDESLKLLSHSNDRIVEDNDETFLMPLVLRILFGRAQTPVTSGLKKSRKTAVITLLPSLHEKYVIGFLRLASEGLPYKKFLEQGTGFDSTILSKHLLRRMAGFAALGNLAIKSLGSKYPNATVALLDPALYTACVSNEVASKKSEEEVVLKQAGNVRQAIMKLILNLFSTVGTLIDWDSSVQKIHKLVLQPRISNFEYDNLQHPSSLMSLFCLWATDTCFYKFLYHDECSVAKALMKLLGNSNAKEIVIENTLNFSNYIIKNPTKDDAYVDLVSLVASTCLRELPGLLKNAKSQEVVSITVDLLLNLVEAGYVDEDETKKYLLSSLAHILEGEVKGVQTADKVKVLQSIASLIIGYNCEWTEIEHLYRSCSKLYRVFAEKSLRLSLNKVFISIGTQFEHLSKVAGLLSELNAYSTDRMESYNFKSVLPAFKKIADGSCQLTDELEWLPVIHTCLYFITDEEELAIRTNATHTIKLLIDYSNSKSSASDAEKAVELIGSDLIPHIKNGLRHKNIEIQVEYISVVSYIIANSIYYTELNDMKSLLFKGDEEANFFTNLTHIQLHRRQRAIKRLGENASTLSGSSISHYLIPMVERYIYCTDEKYRNICNETISTVGLLTHFVTWNQYKAVIRRFTAALKQKPAFLKEMVSLIVQCSKSLMKSMQAARAQDPSNISLKKFPKTLTEPENFIQGEIYPTFKNILNTRNEDTIVARIPLCEATVNFILGLDPNDRGRLLPGALSSICQVLRSRSEELREAVRKSLASISVVLGPEYLTFILNELKSALRRGSQIHILSYTVHSLLVAMSHSLSHKDLDTNSALIVSIIMEDIFGAAGQEKEAEGYSSKLKELKFNKSYDTGEILASNISLPAFGSLLHPIRALLSENLGLKNRRKLDELMRRYALGLNHNEESSSKDALILCYEIFTQSANFTSKGGSFKPKASNKLKARDDSFFIVNLNAKDGRVQTETNPNGSVLQKFSLDLLKAVLARNPNLLEAPYLEGFIPLLQGSLDCDDESVLVSALRVLTVFVKLNFDEDSEGIFKNCARKVLNIIKDSPSTSTEICQVSLKFLSSLIRHKDVKLKDTALSFILERVRPDLNEPNKQGLAFNFLKSLLAKHVVLPEMYDIVDSVAGIMVTNHSKEIRDVSRSVYYQFIMEYDQSRGRLEKQFKFLVSNLEYPSQEGRQSVMELINLIVNKSSQDLLRRLSASFFLSLSNVAVNDNSPRCREMASALLRNLLAKLGQGNIGTEEKYILAWLKQDTASFLELGLRIYKIYLSSMSLGANSELDGLALSKARKIIAESDAGSETEWNLVYTALNVLTAYVDATDEAFAVSNTPMWTSVINCLLYPHPWVRLISSRMVNKYVGHQGKLENPFSDLEIQNIAYRIFRQLGAPSISESQATTSIRTIITIMARWQKDNTPFVTAGEGDRKYNTAIDFALSRIGSIIRDEENGRELFPSKKACVQLLALIIQLLDEEQLKHGANTIILSLFTYLEDERRNLDERSEELKQLAQECLELLQGKLSVADFTTIYSSVKHEVTRRRYERRAKRATLAVVAPEAAARRKLKKHARSKEKRKHEKDENGYYHAKNKKRKF
ncbi:Utp20p [Lachancea thermotolerans CBS 6340]|uniref:KLTH0G16588p n=1 Tax=Lachancea thermotolerans (strain ATCC 56472 / CBS 6340 / NRRL Y-8284) TaxID=559295 RepID=C5DNF7_LACTC|nr:KLTH0G16588p [Lachancea thermotolerans CBS 6340]CAR25318.1 KLTH0G16588p [Lachancea thermotolerans CBS 6340]